MIKNKFLETGHGLLYPYLLTLFYGRDDHDVEQGQKETATATPKAPASMLQTAIKLVCCAGGLYVSHKCFENLRNIF